MEQSPTSSIRYLHFEVAAAYAPHYPRLGDAIGGNIKPAYLPFDIRFAGKMTGSIRARRPGSPTHPEPITSRPAATG
jgi:hypothetical protein